MINAVNSNYNSNISFSALPKNLSGASVQNRSADQIYTIIKRALKDADIPIKVTPKDVFVDNSKLFDTQKKVTSKGLELLQKEFETPIRTCQELYGALVKSYKKYCPSDAIVHKIV